ncbi:MAG: quinone-dependent dihydroorotate dehydrogenase [Flavobacteriaceae bacterium]|nr:quinone-dependent dihydroorotate dehydrogenase [Flavobacteriaceae bacterium]
MFYKKIIRPVLFLFSAESVHHLTLNLLAFIQILPGFCLFLKLFYGVKNAGLKRQVFGLEFPNPVGLAAGFDKNAKAIRGFSALGFGFIEIGTVTPKPQSGNPKPRLFRLPKDKAVINRMGFNNEGIQPIVERLKKNKSVLVGGNIGKNKTTPNASASDDYAACFDALYPYVDYFVVNVSSPNTPNLRALQEKEPLKQLLGFLQQLNRAKPKSKPILLKMAPDLTESQLDDIIEIVQATEISGIIATNTTIIREALEEVEKAVEAGGLSGKPLADRSTEVIRYLHQKSKAGFPIIGVGGISSPQDAIEKIEAGATLVQVYTGLIYEGPGLVKRINKALLKS